MANTFRIGESVRVKINGPGTVVGVGFTAGDAIMVQFPDGKQQPFTPHELERIPAADRSRSTSPSARKDKPS